MAWTCKRCGNENTDDTAVFCAYCKQPTGPGLKAAKPAPAAPTAAPPAAPPAAAQPTAAPAAPPGKKAAPDSIGDRVTYWILVVAMFLGASVILGAIAFDRLVALIILAVVGAVWLALDFRFKAASTLQAAFGGGGGKKALRKVFKKEALKNYAVLRFIFALVFIAALALITLFAIGPNPLFIGFFTLVPLVIIASRGLGLVIGIGFLLAVAFPAAASIAQGTLSPVTGVPPESPLAQIPVLGPIFAQWGQYVGIALGGQPPPEAVTPAQQVGGRKAVEITQLALNKRTVGKGEVFFFNFDIEHQGDPQVSPAALLTRYGAYFDTRAREGGAKILDPETREPVPSITDSATGLELGSGFYQKNISFTMLPRQSRRLSFPLLAPMCSGTFRAGAFVEYEYGVDAGFLVSVYNLDTFLQEQQEGTLQITRGRAQSSAGPFLLSIDTLSQPITTTEIGAATPARFPIDVEVRNQRENSVALVENITIRILPAGLVAIDNPDVCDFEGDDATGVYTAKRESKLAGKKTPPFTLSSKESEPFKCDFRFTTRAVKEIQKSQINVIARVDYNLLVFADTGFTVQSTATGDSCQQELENIARAQKFVFDPARGGFPVNKSRAIEALAGRICGCSTYWGQGGEQVCGADLAINLEGCGAAGAGGVILGANEIMDFASGKYGSFKCAERPERIGFYDERGRKLGDGKTVQGWVLNGNSTYTIRTRYTAPWLQEPWIEVRIVNTAADTLECRQPDLSACRKDEAVEMCKSSVCDSKTAYPPEKASQEQIDARIAEQRKKLTDAGVDIQTNPAYEYIKNPANVCYAKGVGAVQAPGCVQAGGTCRTSCAQNEVAGGQGDCPSGNVCCTPQS